MESIIDKIRVKQLFDLGFNRDYIAKYFDNKYHLNTLYSWKKLSYNVDSIILKKKAGRPLKATSQIRKKIISLATKKNFSTRAISKTLPTKISHESVRSYLRKACLKPSKKRICGNITNLHKNCK